MASNTRDRCLDIVNAFENETVLDADIEVYAILDSASDIVSGLNTVSGGFVASMAYDSTVSYLDVDNIFESDTVLDADIDVSTVLASASILVSGIDCGTVRFDATMDSAFLFLNASMSGSLLVDSYGQMVINGDWTHPGRA